jgi:hypothetical protein
MGSDVVTARSVTSDVPEMTAAEFNAMQEKQSTRKYRNKPVEEDGHHFDSQAEYRRYCELKLMRDAGDIESLCVHPRFDLPVNGVKISRYTADFCYVRDGQMIVEDVKSGPTRTRAYVLRKKLMKAIHGIDIVEVTA